MKKDQKQKRYCYCKTPVTDDPQTFKCSECGGKVDEARREAKRKKSKAWLLRNRVIRREIKKLDTLYLQKENPYTKEEINAMSRPEAIELCIFIKEDIDRPHIKQLYTQVCDCHAILDSDLEEEKPADFEMR